MTPLCNVVRSGYHDVSLLLQVNFSAMQTYSPIYAAVGPVLNSKEIPAPFKTCNYVPSRKNKVWSNTQTFKSFVLQTSVRINCLSSA